MVIFVDEQIPLLANSLAFVGEVHTFNGRTLTRKQLLDTNCEVLFVRSTTKVNRELLEGTNVKFVGTATSGTDHIDTDFLNANSIFFADAKGSNANSVAEYVIFSILHWAKIHNLEIEHLSIGIIGFGNIGKLVAKYSNLLGMKVLVNDPPLYDESVTKNTNSFPDYVNYLELEDLLSQSTIVTNHVPLTQSGKYPTYLMLNKAKLHLVKEKSLFIHTSRGGVVVEKDLLQAKNEKNLTLVVDVWQNEPNINIELVENCLICTPHVAGYSFEGKLRGTLKMLQEFEKFSKLHPDYSLIEKEMANYNPLPIEYFKNPEFIYNQICESRKILEDTEQFKSIVSISNPFERANYFDWLRKNYPKRREIL